MNSYTLCYWRRLLPSCSRADLVNVQSTAWRPLELSLSLREIDVSWRVRHDAICTPQMAYIMGLRPHHHCFFCNACRPNWWDLLVCPHLDKMSAVYDRLGHSIPYSLFYSILFKYSRQWRATRYSVLAEGPSSQLLNKPSICTTILSGFSLILLHTTWRPHT